MSSSFSHFIGRDAEEAYAEIFGGKIVGGVDDNGLDISTGNPDVPHVQVKSSVKGAMSFMTESIRRKRFIPIAVGEPGAKEEMIETLLEFGGWVAHDIPGREDLLLGIAQVRAICNA